MAGQSIRRGLDASSEGCCAPIRSSPTPNGTLSSLRTIEEHQDDDADRHEKDNRFDSPENLEEPRDAGINLLILHVASQERSCNREHGYDL